MDKYIYEVVETEQQEYQEAKPGRNLFFDFEDGDRYFFTSPFATTILYPADSTRRVRQPTHIADSWPVQILLS